MVARLRVSTSGTGALSDDYANGAPTAGLQLTSGGPGLPPTWGPSGAALVNRVLFVDAVNSPGLTANGTLAAPYATIQQAINHAVALGWTEVQVQLAFATYADAVAIPATLFSTSIVGWNPVGPTAADPVPIIGGDITLTTGGGLSNGIHLANCWVTAANIHTSNRGEDMFVSLVRTICAATITAENLEIEQSDSNVTGDVTGQSSLIARFDGPSWAASVNAGNLYSPAGYTRTFADTGANVAFFDLTANGVAIGTTVFVAVAEADTRAGDFAVLQKVAPVAVDYLAGFDHTAAGQLFFWLTNLSRASTNFAEPCSVLIFHQTMAEV